MKKIIYILIFLFAPLISHGAVFYIDFGCQTSGAGGTNICGNGTSSTTPFGSIQPFSDVARSPGDIAFVKRYSASTTNMADVQFTSDGTLNNPIFISADNDNIWNQSSTSAQTYTVSFGEKTMTASATITGISAGTWVYVVGDCTQTYNPTTINKCEYFYEVASVSGTTLTLYLPYKGLQSGSGLSLRLLGDAPIWGLTTSDFQFAMSGDHYWWIQGLHLRGTDVNCNVSMSTNKGTHLRDMILSGNGVTDCGFRLGNTYDEFEKIRTFGNVVGITSPEGGRKSDMLIDCNSVAASSAISVSDRPAQNIWESVEVRNCTNYYASATNNHTTNIFVNTTLRGVMTNLTGSTGQYNFFEDLNSVPGNSQQNSNQVSVNTSTASAYATTTMATTSNLRTGGGAVNMVVFPPSGTGDTGISTNYYPNSYIKILDYPIYTDTSSRTYTVYVNSTSTASWTNDPTATEFWLECNFYGHATNAHRKKTRSTGVVDFNGSTAWLSLSVTCQPAQNGVLYLRMYYGKPKESQNNWFYVDLTPVVS